MQDTVTSLTDGFTVTYGKARIHVIDVIHDTPDFLVMEIDMDSKYIEPVVAWGDADSDGSEVWFMASERALKLDESTDKETALLLPAHTAGWSVMAQGGRYTIQIVAWRDPR